MRTANLLSVEHRRHISMGLLILLSTVGFNVMRGMREAVVFQFGTNGALYTPFIRLFGILPVSTLLLILYLKVKKKYDTLRAYYIIVFFFLSYFVAYSIFAEPGITAQTNYLVWMHQYIAHYPPLEFIAGILINWDKTLYYILCESWGSFTLVILFWQMANETYSPQQASRIYPIFSMLGGCGIILSSLVINYISAHTNILRISTLIICLIGISNCFLARYAWKKSYTYRRVQPKTSLSLKQGIQVALRSPYILYLAICIISFSILCTVYENAVRNIIINHYPDEQAILKFWGKFFIGKGLFVIIGNLISRRILQQFGWLQVAIITPIISILSIHFILAIPTLHMEQTLLAYGVPLVILLTTLLQINFAVKYAFFDPTKEMAYIPLSETERTYGKTVADGMGARIGNIGSGIIQSGAIFLAGGTEFIQIAPLLLIACFGISLAWIWAITNVARHYLRITAQPAITQASTAVS